MTRTILTTLLMLVASIVMLTGAGCRCWGGECADDPSRDGLNGLTRLAGHWTSDNGTTETWTVVGREHMEGRGVSGPDFHELLEIRRDDAGHITYYASPMGRQPAVAFRMTGFQSSLINEQTSLTWTFTNPDNDFPQRIDYELHANTLKATISSLMEGDARRTTWVFEREGGKKE